MSISEPAGDQRTGSPPVAAEGLGLAAAAEAGFFFASSLEGSGEITLSFLLLLFGCATADQGTGSTGALGGFFSASNEAPFAISSSLDGSGAITFKFRLGLSGELVFPVDDVGAACPLEDGPGSRAIRPSNQSPSPCDAIGAFSVEALF